MLIPITAVVAAFMSGLFYLAVNRVFFSGLPVGMSDVGIFSVFLALFLTSWGMVALAFKIESGPRGSR